MFVALFKKVVPVRAYKYEQLMSQHYELHRLSIVASHFIAFPTSSACTVDWVVFTRENFSRLNVCVI